MTAQAKSFENGSRNSESVMGELNLGRQRRINRLMFKTVTDVGEISLPRADAFCGGDRLIQ